MVATGRDTERDSARILRLSITGECNLSCFYCKPLGRSRDLFEVKNPVQPSDVSKLIRIVGELGITRVIIGGGEPLLRKDAANFIKSAFAHKGINDVWLVTNGTYLKAFADELRKNGLRKVDINFDTLNYKKYHEVLTKRDDLFRVLDGVDKVEKLNYLVIRLNIYLLNGVNHDEVVDFARMTKDRRLHLRFMEYCPIVQNSDPIGDRPKLSVLWAKREIDNYQRLVQIHDLEDDVPVPTFRFDDAEGKISFLSETEVAAEKSVPSIVFNAEGVLFNELVPNRPHPILAELRKDAKQDKLRKTIEHVMRLHAEVKRRAAAPSRRAVVSSHIRQAAARR